MPKENRTLDREDSTSSVKKRRVTKAAVPADVVPVNIQTDGDLYNSVVDYEEEESSKRNADTDALLYYETCKEFRQLMYEIGELKVKKVDGFSQKVREKRIEASLKILTLKKLNRLEKFRTRQSRDLLQKAREQVDSDHLHLQNLLYESLQLNKEVQKCLEFKSKDEDLEFVSIEEFYANAPEEISKPQITKTNLHELKLARLQWELEQRKGLADECKKFETNLETASKEIEVKKEQLNNLAPALKSILDAAKPLQDNLGINFEKEQKIHETAALLPKALYVLFVQADALSKVTKWISVSIAGECDKIVADESPLDDISSADSDSDTELDTNHRRKTTYQDRRVTTLPKPLPDRMEQRKKDCLKKHPLSIVIKLSLKNGDVACLEFQWLVLLEIVCVLPTLVLSHSKNLLSTDILSTRLILACLQPGDNGEESPNPTTHFQLHRAGMSRFPSNIQNLGIPYTWAQTICGLVLMNNTVDLSLDKCRHNLENTLKLVRKRCVNRISLAKEIYIIERDNLDYPVKTNQRKMNILSVTNITLLEFKRFPGSKFLSDENLINDSFIFYKIVMNNINACIFAYVAISPDYPLVKPVILIEVNHNKICQTGITNQDLHDIEREVNIYEDCECNSGSLTSQLIKLILCLEVFFHVNYPQEFPIISAIFSPRQGRSRSLPLKYSSSAGGIFTHR